MAADSSESGRWGWVPVSFPGDGEPSFVVSAGAQVTEGEHLGTARRTMQDGRILVTAITSPASGVFEGGRIRYCRHPVLHGAACVYCGVNTQRLSHTMRELFERDHAAAAAAASKEPASAARGSGHPSGSSSGVPRPSGAHSAHGRHGADGDSGGGMRLYGGAHGFGLRMTPAQAASMDGERGARLRASRRLVLVLDLDHTLVHATRHACGEDALAAAARGEESEIHVLRDSDLLPAPSLVAGSAAAASASPPHATPGAPASASGGHFIKLRPGVREFLRDAAELFELHVDTFGSREYADAIVRILDPTGALFSGRVISRKDTFHAAAAAGAASAGGGPGIGVAGGSPATMKAHSWLHRSLGDHSMVLIVDDTEAVWPGARNLVLIEPYIFWRVGPGFEANNAAGASPLAVVGGQPLPPAAPRPGPTPPAHRPVGASASPSAHGALAAPSASITGASACPPQLWAEEAAPVLQRDILRVLRTVHAEYFAQFDAAAATAADSASAPPSLPRTDAILSDVMRRVLNGTAVLFSGVFPTNVDASRQPIVRRALAFGASIMDVPPRPPASAVTHVVAQRPGTAKVQAAATAGGVRIVHVDWLAACLRQYRRLPETDFPLAPGYERCAAVDVSRAERELTLWRATIVDAGGRVRAGDGSSTRELSLACAPASSAIPAVSAAAPGRAAQPNVSGQKRRLGEAEESCGRFEEAAAGRNSDSASEERSVDIHASLLPGASGSSLDAGGGSDDAAFVDNGAGESDGGDSDSLEAELLAALLESDQPGS